MKSIAYLKISGLIIVLFSIINPVKGELTLSPLFSDHMVLQRNMPISIWGTAEAGLVISVTINNKTKTSLTNDQGKWKMRLGAMSAGGPFQIKIQGGDKSIFIEDVLVGEVWLCSGQSNMEFPLNRSADDEQESANFNLPQIRLFRLEKIHNLGSAPFSSDQMQKINESNFFNKPFWDLCSPESADLFSAVALHFGKELYDSLQVPIGLIQNAVGGSPIQSWISKESLTTHPQWSTKASLEPNQSWINLEGVNPWLASRAIQNWGNKTNKDKPIPSHPFEPSYLYDSAILPLTPFAIRGVIWYQGESNATHPKSYKMLFEMMVDDWRKAWRQGSFPFYFVQLPRIGTRSRWPEFRAAQEACLNVDNTGMVVTIDQGDRKDVHPKEKMVIGNRLAKLALSKSYGRPYIAESPKIISWDLNKEKSKIVINFEKVGEGLFIENGRTPTGFYLEGYSLNGMDAMVIHPDSIKIKKEQIELFFPSDSRITTVKYAWAPFPVNNIIGSNGLPLAPFKIELPGNN